VQPGDILEPFRSLNLPVGDQRRILCDNARELFRL
jgi:predicted TIM-barrel fold metal-dependent hydrolase